MANRRTKYVSAAQLAERYGVHKATIWRWVKSGILPQPIKFGAQSTRFDLDEVERLDAERR
jgi:prophage regulatory protein